MNVQSKALIKFIFFPAFLLTILLAASSFLFRLAQKNLIGELLTFADIPALQLFSIIPNLIFVATIFIFSIYQPFEKVFKGTLIALIMIMTLLISFMAFDKYLRLDEVPAFVGNHIRIFTFWPTSLLYIILNLLKFNLFSLFIWGFINRTVNISKGIRYYIPFAFILGIVGTFVTDYGLVALDAAHWSLMSKLSIAIFLMLVSFLFFKICWKKVPEDLAFPQNDFSNLHIRFPFLSAAYLLAGCLVVKDFLDFIFKFELRTQFPDRSSYLNLLSSYTMTLDWSILAITFIWAILGACLVINKGWKTAALCASLSTLIGGIIVLSSPLSWLHEGIVMGLLISTTSALFFPLIQLLYLNLPYHKRFRIKIMTEMIVLPMIIAIASLTRQYLLATSNSIEFTTFYLQIFVPLLLTLLIIASLRTSSKFSTMFLKKEIKL